MVTIRTLPPKDSEDWYGHYQDLDTTGREVMNSTAMGRALLRAIDGAAARSAIGASAEGHTHVASEITDFATAVAAVSGSGDGTGGGPITSSQITDATATGRALVTAADATAARTAIGAAAAGATTTVTAANISDATTVGRAVVTAADAAAARTAIGAAAPDVTYSGTEWRLGTATVHGNISPAALSYAMNAINAAAPANGTVPPGWHFFNTTVKEAQFNSGSLANPVWSPAVAYTAIGGGLLKAVDAAAARAVIGAAAVTTIDAGAPVPDVNSVEEGTLVFQPDAV